MTYIDVASIRISLNAALYSASANGGAVAALGGS